MCFLWLNSEEALDGGEDAGGGVGVGAGVVCLGGETLAPRGHDETEGFNQVRVCVEHTLHRGVADFENLCLLQRKNIGSPRLASKQCHFTEEVAFVQGCDCPRATIFTNLNANLSFMYYKHRRARVARANDRLARREDMPDGRLREHRGLV